MDRTQTQAKLNTAYNTWKAKLVADRTDFAGFGPPLLLSVTEEYCQAEVRIIVFGKETNGWEWDENLRGDHPGHPRDWEFPALKSFNDFLETPEGVEGLCWGYREFAFGKWQPGSARYLFWQAFREVQAWPDSGVIWNNLAKCDFYDGNPKGYRSVLRARPEKQACLYLSQRDILLSELSILAPNVCLFFTGPNYDPVLKASFPELKVLGCNDHPQRQFARLEHPSVPTASFRTYHPNYLRPSGNWGYIDQTKLMAFQ